MPPSKAKINQNSNFDLAVSNCMAFKGHRLTLSLNRGHFYILFSYQWQCFVWLRISFYFLIKVYFRIEFIVSNLHGRSRIFVFINMTMSTSWMQAASAFQFSPFQKESRSRTWPRQNLNYNLKCCCRKPAEVSFTAYVISNWLISVKVQRVKLFSTRETSISIQFRPSEL